MHFLLGSLAKQTTTWEYWAIKTAVAAIRNFVTTTEAAATVKTAVGLNTVTLTSFIDTATIGGYSRTGITAVAVATASTP